MQRLYADIASWWPLISAPEEYIGEASFAASLLRTANPPARTVLELGSGGGNNAFHLKSEFEMTLSICRPTCSRSPASSILSVSTSKLT